jgi:hypothetical protein
MSVILHNYLLYDDIMVLNDILRYVNDDLSSDNIYEYMKNNSNNYLIEDNIKLINTNHEEKSQIFEISRGFIDAFIGFTSTKPIIKCDILNNNYIIGDINDDMYNYNNFVIKTSLIPKIINDKIVDNNNDKNILINILIDNCNYVTKNIYKIGFISKSPYYNLYIKIYYDNNDFIKIEDNIIKQCGFYCKESHLRKLWMNFNI